MTSAPPPAIIERARADCLRSLPFWVQRAQAEGIWTKAEEPPTGGGKYWLISVQCAARPKPVVLYTKWSEQERFDVGQVTERPDRFPRFVTDALLAGAAAAIFLRHH